MRLVLYTVLSIIVVVVIVVVVVMVLVVVVVSDGSGDGDDDSGSVAVVCDDAVLLYHLKGRGHGERRTGNGNMQGRSSGFVDMSLTPPPSVVPS